MQRFVILRTKEKVCYFFDNRQEFKILFQPSKPCRIFFFKRPDHALIWSCSISTVSTVHLVFAATLVNDMFIRPKRAQLIPVNQKELIKIEHSL